MRKTLVIENVDMDLLRKQYDMLADMIQRTRDDDSSLPDEIVAELEDLAPLDGLLDMIGSQLLDEE
jgi:hypothetical protein